MKIQQLMFMNHVHNEKYMEFACILLSFFPFSCMMALWTLLIASFIQVIKIILYMWIISLI